MPIQGYPEGASTSQCEGINHYVDEFVTSSSRSAETSVTIIWHNICRKLHGNENIWTERALDTTLCGARLVLIIFHYFKPFEGPCPDLRYIVPPHLQVCADGQLGENPRRDAADLVLVQEQFHGILGDVPRHGRQPLPTAVVGVLPIEPRTRLPGARQRQ